MKKLAAAALVVGLALPTTACKPKKGTANPEDYYPLILVALESGKTAAMIGRNEAIQKENFAGCVTAEVLISATDASMEALSGKLGGTVIVPGIDVDLSDCMPFNPKEPPKPQEDVAVIVEQVVGVALGLGSHYAGKLQSCKKKEAAMGALAYLGSLVGPVAAEIGDADGVFTVPSYTIDLSVCDSGEAPADEGSDSEAEAPAEEAPAEETPAEDDKPTEDAPEGTPAEEAEADKPAETEDGSATTEDPGSAEPAGDGG